MEVKPKKLYGNNAKIDPKKHPASLYEANMAVTQNTNEDKTAAEREDMVYYAKKFVEENKK